MRILPQSIAGRTMLVLLVGLTLSHVGSMAIYYGEEGAVLDLLGGEHAVERVVAETHIIERTPAARRDEVLNSLNSPAFKMSWTPALTERAGAGESWRADLLGTAVQERFAAAGDDRELIAYGSEPGGPVAPDGDVGISVKLKDSTWLHFRVASPRLAAFVSTRFILSNALMVLAIAAGAYLISRWMTRSFGTLVVAAQRLGANVNLPTLPERGPREVRQAARAFNDMVQRIRRFATGRTQMIAAISHDLRTLITRLRLRAEFVEDETLREKMLADLAEMEAMISESVAFAKEDATAGRTEQVDLAALIQDICRSFADLGGAVEYRGETALPYRCQPLQMRRALTNLIDNALKYGKRAQVYLMQNDDTLAIRIEDEGPGIPDSLKEEVFEPFYRIERSRSRETGGAGLGLAIALAIVRSHGGDIRLSDRPSGGLRVDVVLPRRPS